jgi:phosphohistidine phosphatase
MIVYLLRHGTADPYHPLGDSRRALTPDGQRKVRSVVTAAREAGMTPDVILSSPFVRARESAEIAANVVRFKDPIAFSSVFEPGSSPQAAWEEIRKHEGQILVAGHDPLFSSLTGFLLNCPTLQIEFKKAGLVAIEFGRVTSEPRGVLNWYLTPKLCR